MAVEDYVKVYRALLESLISPAEARDAISKLNHNNVWSKGEALKAVYELPVELRDKLMHFLMGG
jgi:hypothetical protein